MTFSKISAVAAATLAGLCISARAEPYDPRDSRNQAVSVSVNYSFTLPTDGGAASSENASERGRRQAYEIAGRECANLLATIAESCSLGSVSVSSQPQRAYAQQQDGINIRATASFKITPKVLSSPEASPSPPH